MQCPITCSFATGFGTVIFGVHSNLNEIESILRNHIFYNSHIADCVLFTDNLQTGKFVCFHHHITLSIPRICEKTVNIKYTYDLKILT